MNSNELAALEGLKRCTFPVASNAKRFIASLQTCPPEKELTSHQAAYLFILTWRFRKRAGQKAINAAMDEFVSRPGLLDQLHILPTNFVKEFRRYQRLKEATNGAQE